MSSKSVAEDGTIDSIDAGPRSETFVPSSTRAGAFDLADVAAFVRVVESGSFTRAAEKSSLPKSALSRRVSRLELSLGTRLLQRTTRSLSLTDAGSAFFERVSSALSALHEARDIATEKNREPAGTVKITATVDVAAGPLSRALARFSRLHPNIIVEVDATPRLVDLVAEGFDFAIRAGKLRDSSLVARKLGESPNILVASPEYLKEHPAPKKLADLEKHACVLFRASKGATVWKLNGPKGPESVTVRGALSGTDFAFVRAAVLRGAGISLVPVPACIEELIEGRLEQVLPKYLGPSSPIHLVYPSARFVPQRVALLRDYLLENLNVSCPSREDPAFNEARARFEEKVSRERPGGCVEPIAHRMSRKSSARRGAADAPARKRPKVEKRLLSPDNHLTSRDPEEG